MYKQKLSKSAGKSVFNNKLSVAQFYTVIKYWADWIIINYLNQVYV